MFQRFESDVVVVGGAGHVGLPLAIAFASTGLRVTIFDIDAAAVARISSGELPFKEDGADDMLVEALANRTLQVSTDPTVVSSAETVVIVVGTPVDSHLSPDPSAVPGALRSLKPFLRDGQLIVLRSTVYPGVTAKVEALLSDMQLDVAFCPERIAEGRAMQELFELPQLVGARSAQARQRAASLFGKLTNTVVELQPEEAELAKLFTNSWRYIKFAAANQFFMMATDHGVDYETVRSALMLDYPRAADLPGAGFAAGPCLFKDTMQLAAFAESSFGLGHSAMLVNEGLPKYVVGRMARSYPLHSMRVGILGMAFKGESDDTRSSLSYALKRSLGFLAHEVMTTDPYVTTDAEIRPLAEVLDRADLLVIGAPHDSYRDLCTDKPVVDIWNLTPNGVVP